VDHSLIQFVRTAFISHGRFSKASRFHLQNAVGSATKLFATSRMPKSPSRKKAGALTGPARIGRVTFSQTGRTLYYLGQKFQSLKGPGFKSNYYNVETGEDYWISGPKRDGGDALYGGSSPIKIDDDVREEYWRFIRRQPRRIHERVA